MGSVHREGIAMSWSDDDDQRLMRVVQNHEEQYSIWPVDRDLPAGWSESGTQGTKQECLDDIEQIWTDMRPRSLREQQDARS
jgi:MbtH protein